MALDPVTVQAMKEFAKLSPEEVDARLKQWAQLEPEAWRGAINTLILTMWTQNVSLRKAFLEFRQMVVAAAQQQSAAPANGSAGPPLNPPPAIVGGQPVNGGIAGSSSDVAAAQAAQLEAERIMLAVAGPRQGEAMPQSMPTPMMAGRAPKPRPNMAGPARIGASGEVITDPDQLKAEQIMDEAEGSR